MASGPGRSRTGPGPPATGGAARLCPSAAGGISSSTCASSSRAWPGTESTAAALRPTTGAPRVGTGIRRGRGSVRASVRATGTGGVRQRRLRSPPAVQCLPRAWPRHGTCGAPTPCRISTARHMHADRLLTGQGNTTPDLRHERAYWPPRGRPRVSAPTLCSHARATTHPDNTPRHRCACRFSSDTVRFCLAFPTLPSSAGYGGNILASREGGSFALGYNKYNDDSDESSSESEPEQPSVDEIDVSTLSFVSNGERVWRPPDGVFSKRRQSSPGDLYGTAPAALHLDQPEQAAGKRNSEGADSNGSRRSSAGPDVPRLNFSSISAQQEQSTPAKEQRETRRPSSARCISFCRPGASLRESAAAAAEWLNAIFEQHAPHCCLTLRPNKQCCLTTTTATPYDREASRPNTPSASGSPIINEHPPEFAPSSMHRMRNDSGRAQSLGGGGNRLASTCDLSSNQQVWWLTCNTHI
jgi:hypothetical protein